MSSDQCEDVIVPGQGIRRVKILDLRVAIGFSGKVQNGLLCSPDGLRAFYPLGSSIVARTIGGHGQQTFLTGHTYPIGCIAISTSGNYLASGETSNVGTKVQVIVWNARELIAIGDYVLHHANVAAVGISPNDRYVVSAGGKDDPTVLVWDIATRTPLCVGRKTYDRPFVSACLSFSHHRDDTFIVGGQDAIQVWKFDDVDKKLSSTVISLGKIRRHINYLLVRANSDYVFCATDSGDIVKVSIDQFIRNKVTVPTNLASLIVACAVKRVPKKCGMNGGKFVGGVLSMLELKPNELLVGSGDGSVSLVLDKSGMAGPHQKRKPDGITRQLNEPTTSCLQEMKSKQFPGSVTSLTRLDSRAVLVGCDNGDIFQMDILTMDATLLSSCHTGRINALAFPRNLEAVMATCGEDGLRVWEVKTGRQVMNVTEPSTAISQCILFSPDGKSIISGWSDGCLRAHTPETGRLIFLTQGAHTAGVTALAYVAAQRGALISGGKDGQMRTWILGGSLFGQGKPALSVTVREHKAQVVNIEVTKDETECISASKDGACIIWDIRNLAKLCRKQILNCTAALVWSLYHPSESQILTLATDSQLSYWEVFNAEEIRQLVLGRHSSLTALSISRNGEHFITATQDSLVKIWKYKQGSLCAIGKAKAGPITRVQYSPSGNYVVAITEEGAVLVWENYENEN